MSCLQRQHTCIDRIRVIPLQVLRRAVPDVRSKPKWVVAWVKGTILSVELIAEDQNHLIAIDTRASLGRIGRVRVNEASPDVKLAGRFAFGARWSTGRKVWGGSRGLAFICSRFVGNVLES